MPARSNKSQSKPAVPAGITPPGGNEAVTRAYRKLMAREALTKAETAAVKAFEAQKEERLRWQYYASIPQKHWKRMTGRQTKVLHEQAARYGLPFGGAFIDLTKLAKALHDFLAENAIKLNKDDADLIGPASPALERYREERALLARLDRMERERELLPRQDVRLALGRIASLLRSAGDALQRQFGPQAAETLYEALGDAEREVEHYFGDEANDDGRANGADGAGAGALGGEAIVVDAVVPEGIVPDVTLPEGPDGGADGSDDARK